MKRILILSLLFPFTPLNAGSARRVGTAIVKLIEYRKYTDGQTRSQCIATHKMLLHEHRTENQDIAIEPGVKTTITITPLHAKHALLSINEKDDLNNTTITPTEPLVLNGGYYSYLRGPSYSYKKIEIRLTENDASNNNN